MSGGRRGRWGGGAPVTQPAQCSRRTRRRTTSGGAGRESFARPPRPALLALATGAVTLLVAITAIGTWPVGVFQDDGIYAILGKALATGHGYRYLNIPGLPHATHYPPAYPAFLALLWKVAPAFPQNVALLTFTSASFLALAAVGAHAFARARGGLSGQWATGVCLATVASVPILIFGVYVLSEPMFMALLFPALLLAERAAEVGRPREALAAGLVAGALAMVRTPGALLLPALVLALGVRRRWTPAGLALVAGALFIVPWQLWAGAHAAEIPPVLVGKYGSYGGWLAGALRSDGIAFLDGVVRKNLHEVADMAGKMFSGVDPGGAGPGIVLRSGIVGMLLGLMALGTIRAARRIPVTLLFIAAYLSLVLVWPFDPTRFVWAILPLFGILMAAGTVAIGRWRPRHPGGRAIRGTAVALAALLGCGFAIYNVRGVRQRWWDTIPRANTERATPLVAWARTHTAPGDVLATDDDALLNLYTDRRTVPVGTFTPQEYLRAQTYAFAADQLARIIARYQPRYVLCSTSYGVMAARELARRDPAHMRIAAVLTRGVVYERTPE